MEPNLPAVDLERLEGRVQQAAEMIQKLRTERDELKRLRDELEARLRTTESVASGAEELRRRVQDAETRVTHFSEERVALARRVEQMLEKLRAVEEEQLGAAH
jgi:FtsZ-binding cell division protein ZapB